MIDLTASIFLISAAALGVVSNSRDPIADFFNSSKPQERSKLIAEIKKSADNAIEVAKAIGGQMLWPDQPASGAWAITLPSDKTANILFRLPHSYDPKAPPVPVVLVYASENESSDAVIDRAAAGIGPAAAKLAWVLLREPLGGTFHLPGKTSADLPAVLREIRRRIRVDSNRIYLFGEGQGGHAAFLAAIMYPQEFAGAIIVGGYPRVPYPAQALALLLPNVRSPLHWFWRDEAGQNLVHPVNERIMAFAKAAGLPMYAHALSHASASDAPLPATKLEELFSAPRTSPRRGQVWFRYLAQGSLGWVRTTEFAGEVWDDDQLSIEVSPVADRDEFITKTLKEKLAFLGGNIEGQTISIETHRCAAVELRLGIGQVDFAKPVTVLINGRKRFDGLLGPDVSDVLESAYETWDFQNPVLVRKSFTIHAEPPRE